MSEHESSETTIIVNDPSTIQSPEKDPLRICKTCGLKAYTKTDLKLFVKNKNSPCGRENHCKKCRRKYKQKHYQKHKEEIKKKRQKYYQEHKEEKRKYSRKYYHEHKEERKKYRQKYYQEHKEEMKKISRKYYQEHKEEKRKYRQKYYQEHKEEIKKKRQKYHQMWGFLYRSQSGYLTGDGCCMWPDCYTIDPFVLHNHHLWKEDDPDFTITLCANHHEYFTHDRPAFLDFFTEEE